jgi:endonuclease/exonuclease/phosphatase family metal-dependent hydrolase
MISWTRRAALAALFLVSGTLAPATAAATPADLKVMTRNVYLGGDIFHPLGSQDAAEFERKAGELWADVQKTNFPLRAKLLAKEVKRTRPDLIGLQEVALWRRGPDGLQDGATTPATQVVYDFLSILQRELKRAGLRYRVGAKQQEANLESPIDAGYDVRLTMFDVVLVKKRRGLRVQRSLSKNYVIDVGVPTPIGTIRSRRGWAAVDATLSGRRFRFVDTHLESALEQTRVDQAKELIGPNGPLRVHRPIILVGDFNSDPNGKESPSSAFDVLKRFGLVDSWPQINPGNPGYACCLDHSDLSDTTAEAFDHRIDLILTKPRLLGVSAQTVGTRVSDRAGGLWPSDHGGVVATFRLR